MAIPFRQALWIVEHFAGDPENDWYLAAIETLIHGRAGLRYRVLIRVPADPRLGNGCGERGQTRAIHRADQCAG
jgi:hypothetical protein